LVVLDAAGNALTTATRSWPTANGGAVMYLPAGEYRIRVWSKTNADASYQFRLVEGRTDADDALAKATDLRLPAGEAMVLDVTLGDGANGVADQDHYRLMLAEGQMLTASALTAGAAALTLLDATGQALATDDNGSLQFVASATGVYHLRVTPQAGLAQGQTRQVQVSLSRSGVALPAAGGEVGATFQDAAELHLQAGAN